MCHFYLHFVNELQAEQIKLHQVQLDLRKDSMLEYDIMLVCIVRFQSIALHSVDAHSVW